MEKMTSWENRLRSWTPRPPSDRLERRLFGRRRWLVALPAPWQALAAPAAICFLFGAVMLRHTPPRLENRHQEDVDASVGWTLTNASLAGQWFAQFYVGQNAPPSHEMTLAVTRPPTRTVGAGPEPRETNRLW
jgi:hypothetical protein